MRPHDRDELAYLQRRAREERAAADCCDDIATVSAHKRLAREYERRAAALDADGGGGMPPDWPASAEE